MALIMLASPALAQGPVLLPSAGPALEQTFAETNGEWVLRDAKIGPGAILGRACSRAGACADFQVSPSSPTCAGTPLPSGCAVVKSSDVIVRSGLLSALQALANPWRMMAVPSNMPASSARSDQPSSALTLLLWFGVPSLLALAIAWLARRWKPSLGLVAVGALSWIAVGTIGSLVGGLWLLWDGVAMGCLAATCWVAMLTPVRRAGVAIASLSAMLALLALEGGMRLAQTPQPAITPPTAPPWRVARDLTEEVAVRQTGFCALWGPPLGDDPGCAPPARLHLKPKAVLHIGDSMLQGAGVAGERNLTSWLEVLTPDTSHVNVGVAPSSLDLQAAIADRWLQSERFQLVVMHVFAGNDMEEIGARRLYCADAPLLVTEGDATRVRCPKPSIHTTRAQLLFRYSPPPWPLRWWAIHSQLARAVARAFVSLPAATESAQGPPAVQAEAQYREALRYLLQAASTRGVSVVAVMMPGKRSVSGDRFAPAAARLRHVLQASDVTVLESQPLFDAVTRSEGESAVFLGPGDPHLNEHGLELLARWLAPQLSGWNGRIGK